ncbi:hypothetical protein E2C01_066878 [Portunus trituberculatus]|uniref:Uncharacterized protein n=1 Tax=Portunus trituberculatus TaxID=210409 RepID=A0A5B7HRX6_PORTR|nr:hypothetical protein [Portunus trituberculatus]
MFSTSGHQRCGVSVVFSECRRHGGATVGARRCVDLPGIKASPTHPLPPLPFLADLQNKINVLRAAEVLICEGFVRGEETPRQAAALHSDRPPPPPPPPLVFSI